MNYDDEDKIEIACPYCDHTDHYNYSDDDFYTCSNCGESFALDHDDTTDYEQDLFSAVPTQRKRGWLKNLVAILIGIVVGVILRVLIALPLLLIWKDGLPFDIELILEIFTAFVAGSLTGSLVPRLGWLFGLLTQVLKIIGTVLFFGVWIYIMSTEADYDFSLAILKTPVIRLMAFAMIAAAIGGAIAEKYRQNIWTFLSTVFGVVGGGVGCVLQAIGGIVYLYILYIAGKALFEEGEVFKAFVIAFVVGPLLSYIAYFILMGIGLLCFWLYSKLHNWYAEDLGLELVE